VLILAALAVHSGLASTAWATLKFYYDPVTGSVSFDTSESRSGGLYIYALAIDAPAPAIFRPENLIRLSTTTLYDHSTRNISDATFTNPWQGLYTIGNILPPGLSEQFWTTSFLQANKPGLTYEYEYSDVVGGGEPPAAEFIYGAPSGEFKNRWDLVDPNTLSWATSAKLVYHPHSGEVVLDTTGDTSGYISAILLQSTGKFLSSGFTPFVDTAFKDASPNLISLFADAIEPGKYSLGRILGAGLSQADFEDAFTGAQFLGRAGFKGSSFDFATYGVTIQLQSVPEPSTLALIATGVLALLGLVWRSRRS
jgi:hypothetical protein